MTNVLSADELAERGRVKAVLLAEAERLLAEDEQKGFSHRTYRVYSPTHPYIESGPLYLDGAKRKFEQYRKNHADDPEVQLVVQRAIWVSLSDGDV